MFIKDPTHTHTHTLEKRANVGSRVPFTVAWVVVVFVR